LTIIVEWAAAGDLKRQLRKTKEKGSKFEERIIWKYFKQIGEAMRVSRCNVITSFLLSFSAETNSIFLLP
jgi:hypothetical protein